MPFTVGCSVSVSMALEAGVGLMKVARTSPALTRLHPVLVASAAVTCGRMPRPAGGRLKIYIVVPRVREFVWVRGRD